MPRSATSTPKKPAVRRTPIKRSTRAKTADAPVVRVSTKKVIERAYIFAVGRRKTAVARVRWHVGKQGDFMVNGRPMNQYFPTPELQSTVMGPLTLTEMTGAGYVTAKVNGGGVPGQAESVRLGIARALVHVDPDLRLTLKRAGFLRRDPRAKERKKYGLKRARRAPQWQKR